MLNRIFLFIVLIFSINKIQATEDQELQEILKTDIAMRISKDTEDSTGVISAVESSLRGLTNRSQLESARDAAQYLSDRDTHDLSVRVWILHCFVNSPTFKVFEGNGDLGLLDDYIFTFDEAYERLRTDTTNQGIAVLPDQISYYLTRNLPGYLEAYANQRRAARDPYSTSDSSRSPKSSERENEDDFIDSNGAGYAGTMKRIGYFKD